MVAEREYWNGPALTLQTLHFQSILFIILYYATSLSAQSRYVHNSLALPLSWYVNILGKLLVVIHDKHIMSGSKSKRGKPVLLWWFVSNKNTLELALCLHPVLRSTMVNWLQWVFLLSPLQPEWYWALSRLCAGSYSTDYLSEFL